MKTSGLHLRTATKSDLDAINNIIEAAVMTWPLADRVKRLSLPTYKYNELDLQHLHIVVAENEVGEITGVAAWYPANTADTPKNKTALLLHGIYIDPTQHRKGIGSQLFQAAEQAVRKQNLQGLLVKAKAGSELFYQAHGMKKLVVDNTDREFVNRYWKLVS